MRILRGIRMMMVRLITRATCHCEMCATCFPEGGVPTALAMAYQSVTKHHKQRPPIDDLGPNDLIVDCISTPDYLSSQAIPCLEGSVSSGSAVMM